MQKVIRVYECLECLVQRYTPPLLCLSDLSKIYRCYLRRKESLPRWFNSYHFIRVKRRKRRELSLSLSLSVQVSVQPLNVIIPSLRDALWETKLTRDSSSSSSCRFLLKLLVSFNDDSCGRLFPRIFLSRTPARSILPLSSKNMTRYDFCKTSSAVVTTLERRNGAIYGPYVDNL